MDFFSERYLGRMTINSIEYRVYWYETWSGNIFEADFKDFIAFMVVEGPITQNEEQVRTGLAKIIDNGEYNEIFEHFDDEGELLDQVIDYDREFVHQSIKRNAYRHTEYDHAEGFEVPILNMSTLL